jgi:hypothetical protein
VRLLCASVGNMGWWAVGERGVQIVVVEDRK